MISKRPNLFSCDEFVFLLSGEFEVGGANIRKLKANNINMICGGSGLTPMYQVLKYILNSSTDSTKIALVFANRVGYDFLHCSCLFSTINMHFRPIFQINLHFFCAD